jgi:hypothetical protein
MKKDYYFVGQVLAQPKELKIQIPEGQEIDWQESAKQEKIVFKKKDNKPKSWEEYCENHKGGYAFISNWTSSVIGVNYPPNELLKLNPEVSKHLLPSKELAEAFLAMMQIMSLRQAWIGNWNSNQLGYAIMLDVQRNIIASHDVYPTALTFPDRNMAVDFMNTFKDLLEIAKPLI